QKPVRARVAVVRTSPATVQEDYARALELSGCADVLRAAPDVVAYGNLTWSRYIPGASSPPWQLEGLAALANGSGRRWQFVAGTGHTSQPRRGARDARWPGALGRHGQRFEPLGRTQILPYPRGRRLLMLQRVLPTGLPVPRALAGTAAVHLPTLKTHGLVGLAGAMENAWSAWMPAGGGAAAAHPHEVLVDLLLLQRETHSAVCAVMDGTIVGDGAGPRTVEPREANVLLASTDPVALDATAARLAGLDPFGLRYLALAYALGLGCADTDAIEVVGDEMGPGELQLRARRPPAALARTVLEELRLSRLEDWLFRRRWLAPASAVYYDLVWLNVVGRARLAAFRRTDWGKLFMSYPSQTT
ncbi:MAG TPA: DUF362 domain-containing protein, partial [Chloroflexota bacterium]|nr:DUF362 domain-containing protein [Chloroflexota bacterium]